MNDQRGCEWCEGHREAVLVARYWGWRVQRAPSREQKPVETGLVDWLANRSEICDGPW